MLVTLRWAVVWGAAGLLLGFAGMFGKAPPFAESGGKPDNVFFYAFWVPIGAVLGTVFGLVLGALFAFLMAMAGKWRQTTRPADGGTTGSRLVCGAIAGGILGLLITRSAGALIIAAFGVATAIASAKFAWLRADPS